MDNIAEIEEYYKIYSKKISTLLPDGIVEIDLNLLQKLNLLNFHHEDKKLPGLTRYFNVIETTEKITLINDHFVIWIVPEKINSLPVTHTLIAINHPDYPHLELVFAVSGVYNTSRLVLRVLEVFLEDIQETEEMLLKLSKS